MATGYSKRWQVTCKGCQAKISQDNALCDGCRRPLFAVNLSGQAMIGCSKCGKNFPKIVCGRCKTDNVSGVATIKSGGGLLSKVGYATVGLLILGALMPKEPREKTSTTLIAPQEIAMVEASATPTVEKAKPLKLSVTEITQRTESNELRFREEVKKAGGVSFTGKVIKIDAGMFFSGPHLNIATNNQFLPMSAFLKSEFKDRATQLDPGDKVELICQNPTSLVGTALYDCVLK